MTLCSLEWIWGNMNTKLLSNELFFSLDVLHAPPPSLGHFPLNTCPPHHSTTYESCLMSKQSFHWAVWPSVDLNFIMSPSKYSKLVLRVWDLWTALVQLISNPIIGKCYKTDNFQILLESLCSIIVSVWKYSAYMSSFFPFCTETLRMSASRLYQEVYGS